MHKFQKERRRNSQGCFECGNTTHFIINCPMRKKYDYSKRNYYSNKNDYKKKRNIKKIMSQVCAALSDFDFSSEDLSSSEEDENINYKKRKTTSPGCASWSREDLHRTTLTPTPVLI
jgi:hypothetical protein